MSVSNLFFRAYNRVLARYSNFIFRSVLRTPAVATDPNSETILYTLLDRSNCCAYLLAVKSFLRYLEPGSRPRVVVQSDGSLDAGNVQRLRSHLHGVEILDHDETRRIISERAGTELLRLLPDWDQCHCPLLVHKLLNVIYRFPGKKVILFDSDLLILREPVFVLDWVRDGQGTCFHSGGGNGLTLAFRALGFDFSRVDINDFNSGFIGLHNEIDDRFLAEVFARIHHHDPALFIKWEIEQSIWAVLFNRMPDPVNLDRVEKDYVASGWWPYERIRRSVLVHFVGSIRFKNLRYVRLAHQVIRELIRQPQLCPQTD